MTLLNEELDEETTAATATGGDDGGDDNGGNNGAAAAAAAAMPGNVRASDIVGEMQTAYLDYAMSVIVSRALPDVRDGLKPVHRRILYAMSHDLYLHHTKPHRKSARIVGEVLGKYHPHGDVAVYDAMVRMAQEFSLRYPLIDGQGNFGSIDGDGAAAMRYTEARLAEIAELMLADLDKDTVEWHDNFDNSLEEPDILPAALPNLLINGSSGIAVGMATNIPPHNLGEIVDALVYLIDRYKEVEEITVDDLLQFVKGPDFPTGGILYRFREDKADEHTDVVAQGYAMGRARLVMQAKAHFEEMSRGRSRIVVTELPYQTNKTALIERIATLARDGKIEGITDLRDESDRSGMRIVVELTRNADPKDILKDLFKYTPLQQTFGMQMLALVDGQPRLLSLKRALHLFVQHREEIIRRRSEYDLAKARDRAHIVEGLLKALDILDEVIDTIRRSQTVETARNNLVKNFKFTEIQAQAILDMQLRRLAALERKKLKEEYDALMERIAYLEDLLAHPEKILAVIREDLLAQKEKYGDARRTQIVDRTKGTLTSTDLLPQQDVWVTVSEEGDLRRQDVAKPDVATLRKLAKYGRVAMLTANTRDWLYLFCRDGRCTRVPIHELPQNGTPKHVSELTDWGRRDTITAALSVPRISPVQAQGYLFLATALGDVKRVTMADFVSNNNAEFTAIAVDPKDRLGWVFPTPGEQEVMLITGTGQSIRFSEEDVRSMGLAAGGVGGIKLKKNDTVIHADLVEPESAGTVLTMTAQGYAKRSALSEYNRQGRNGSGIVTHKPTNRTGNVTAALILEAGVVDEEVIATITAKRKVDPIHVRDIPVMGRGVQGKQVIALSTGDQVAALKRILESTTPTGSPFDGTPDNGNGSNGSGPIAPSSNGSSNGSGSATNGTGSLETTGRGSANGATAGKTTAKRNTAARKRSTKSSSQGATPVAQQQSKPKRAKRSSTKETTVKEATVKAIATETVAPSTTTPLTTTPSTINGAQEATSRKQPQAKQRTRKQSRAKAATTRTAASTATHRGQTEAAKEQKGAVSTAKATGKTTAKAAPTAKETAKEKTTASATATAKHRQPKAKRQAATSTTDASTRSGTPRAVKDKTKSTREPSTTTEPASKKTTQKKATQKKAVAAKTSSTKPATTKAATAKNAAAKATKSATSQQKKPKSGSDKVTRVATGAGNSKTSARLSTGTNKGTTKRATKKDATATVVGSKAETTKRTAKQTAKNPPAKRSAKGKSQAESTPAKRTAVTAKKKPATAKQRKLQTATSVPKAGKRA